MNGMKRIKRRNKKGNNYSEDGSVNAQKQQQ